MTTRIVVGITGATGAAIGIRILELLGQAKVETHLILSDWAKSTIRLETGHAASEIVQLADYHYAFKDQSAPISSGSFIADGMIVVPCSMKTLAAIRIGLSDNLLTRAADVALKERRRLVLVVRETPFNTIHLENMLELSRMGTVVLPPVMTFYNQPESVDDMVSHVAYRVLDQFSIHLTEAKRWTGVHNEKL